MVESKKRAWPTHAQCRPHIGGSADPPTSQSAYSLLFQCSTQVFAMFLKARSKGLKKGFAPIEPDVKALRNTAVPATCTCMGRK